MKIFFDTEFEGLYKNANLISIGLIDENGKQLYIENDDIIPEYQSEWIKDNVLPNTVNYGDINILEICDNLTDYFVGRDYQICNKLTEFFKQYDYVELVSDVCHYDMVQLIDIFGDAFSLPENVCCACYDINQDIARFKGISLQEAFDYNREELLKELGVEDLGAINKHNSLYDAKIIKKIYEIYNKE